MSTNVRTSGAEAFPLVVELGAAQPAGTDQARCAHAETSLRERHYLSAPPHHLCGQRIAQREDPMGEVHGPWFSQPAELHQRHLLPLRRARHEPRTHSIAGSAHQAERHLVLYSLQSLNSVQNLSVLGIERGFLAVRGLRIGYPDEKIREAQLSESRPCDAVNVFKRDTFCNTLVLGVVFAYKDLGSHRGLVNY